MKWVIASIVLFLVLAAYVSASGPVAKPVSSVCPACHLPIAEGQDHVFRIVKSKSTPLHFTCAHNRIVNPRRLELKQIQAELRKGKK